VKKQYYPPGKSTNKPLLGEPKKDTEKENYTTRWIADQQLMG